jgi:hypothetical protein
MTSKLPVLDRPADLRQKTEQAAAHCPCDLLAVSPQFGLGRFADNGFMP